MKFPQNNIIDTWLAINGDPEIAKFVEKNLAIATKVNTILKERGIKKIAFAKMLSKKPSEITKILSGAHNITLKTITKMEVALNVDLINIETISEIQKVLKIEIFAQHQEVYIKPKEKLESAYQKLDDIIYYNFKNNSSLYQNDNLLANG